MLGRRLNPVTVVTLVTLAIFIEYRFTLAKGVLYPTYSKYLSRILSYIREVGYLGSIKRERGVVLLVRFLD